MLGPRTCCDEGYSIGKEGPMTRHCRKEARLKCHPVARAGNGVQVVDGLEEAVSLCATGP